MSEAFFSFFPGNDEVLQRCLAKRGGGGGAEGGGA